MNNIKFDQHFLINKEILQIIVDEMGNISNASILEIGGGKGILTQEIIKKFPKKFTCVELDDSMILYLQQLFKSQIHNLVHEDAINYLKSLHENDYEIIVGNIPYGITESLYTQLYFLLPKKVIFLQSHKTTRTLIEKKNTKQSLLINALYNIKCIEIVNGDNFEPIAKTKSSIIRLDKKNEKNQYEKFLSELTKRYNQTFYNSCIYSLAKILEIGKKDVKSKLEEFNLEISKDKIDVISNEEFIQTIELIKNKFLE